MVTSSTLDRAMVERIVRQYVSGQSAPAPAPGTAPELRVNVSARHIHLCDEHVERLFGPGATLTEMRSLYQDGFFAAEETLMLVGPVMAEWRKLNFAGTFEILRRVVHRLNEISQQLDALGTAGREAQDDSFELSYRDYLLQRFSRVEAGTVRMTTNLAVDMRALFVMPRVRQRPRSSEQPDEAAEAMELMDLAGAREPFGRRSLGKTEKNLRRIGGRDGRVRRRVRQANRPLCAGRSPRCRQVDLP